MSLSIEELKRLEGLCKISLNEQEQDKFLNQIDGIIWFLDQLKNLDIPDNFEKEEKEESIENSLRLVLWAEDCDFKQNLIANVEHEVMNNSVVIKSVLAWNEEE